MDKNCESCRRRTYFQREHLPTCTAVVPLGRPRPAAISFVFLGSKRQLLQEKDISMSSLSNSAARSRILKIFRVASMI